MSDFSKRLAAARKTANLKQREVAAAIGVAQGTYAAYETGAREPDVEKLKVIAAVLGVSADMLLGTNAYMRTSIQQIYDSLSRDGREQLMDYGQFLLEKEHKKNTDASVS
jgi:transcriptional regulator with XRE-family HTH domain